MSTVESIFVQVDAGPGEVAGWLVEVLGFERLAGDPGVPDEAVLRGWASTVEGWLGIVVDRNVYGSQDGEEAVAIDGYQIEIGIRVKPDEVLLREARLIFDKLVETRPEVPMLLVHELDALVAAHLPGVGTEYFEQRVTVDAPDQDTWRPWIRS